MLQKVLSRHYKKLLWVLFGAAVLYTVTAGCLFRAVTGIPCPGCGMTHAFLSAFRLDFVDAFRWHPLFPLVMAMMIGYAVCLLVYMLRRRSDPMGAKISGIGAMTKGLVETLPVKIVICFYIAAFAGIYLFRMLNYYGSAIINNLP